MATFRNLVVLALAMMWSQSFAASPEFSQWMGQHGITYETAEEVEYRFGIWRANKAIVEAHNEEHARGRESYTLAMNKFAAMTNGSCTIL